MASTLVALQTVTVGAGGSATVTFSSIPQTYTDLVIQASARGTVTGAGYDLTVGFNGVTTNRTGRQLYGTGSAAGSSTETIYAGVYNGSTATASTFAPINIYIPNYASSNYKSFSVDSAAENNAVNGYQYLTAGLWSSTDAITSIELNSTSGNFVQYSTFTLYGVYNSPLDTAVEAPTIGTATAASTGAYVAFTPSGTGAPATSYVATSSPGNITATGYTSPILVTGLTSGTAYTFTVKGQNPGGTGVASAASNSVTPYDGYESIATLYGNGASSVTFSSIPQTFTHLQVRTFIKGSANDQDVWVNFNGDTASNYSEHRIYGNGSTVVSGGLAPSSKIEYFGRSGSGTSVFGPSIVDILDYKDTNKYTTIRALTGWDNNGSGFIMFTSGSWRSTAAITSMLITPQSGTFASGTVFELYGIR